MNRLRQVILDRLYALASEAEGVVRRKTLAVLARVNPSRLACEARARTDLGDGGLSQRGFAGLLDVTGATVSRWESGSVVPKSAALSLLKLVADDPRRAQRVLGGWKPSTGLDKMTDGEQIFWTFFRPTAPCRCGKPFSPDTATLAPRAGGGVALRCGCCMDLLNIEKPAKTLRKCSICRQTGHDKRRCKSN